MVLLGLPGAGKSTVGALLAGRLGWRFVDLDTVIEAEAGRPIVEIFAEEGEAGFRAREHAATVALAEDARRSERPVVLAPGGGWVEDRSNPAALGSRFISVYLRARPMVLVGRLGESAASRPLVAGRNSVDRLVALLRRRESFYLQANHTVNTDSMSPDEVCDSIVSLVSRIPPD